MAIRSLPRLALRLLFLSLGALASVLAPEAPLAAADFIRGDANGDGVVTISDAHFSFSYVFRNGDPSGCLKALDTDDSGIVDISDGVVLVSHLYLDGYPPPPPYPGRGPDPTADPLGCETYGGGSPLDDPLAEAMVLDAVAGGGADASAFITLGVSSGTSLGGYSCRIGVEGDVFDHVAYMGDLSGTLSQGFWTASVVDRAIQVAFISNIGEENRWIGPGERLAVSQVAVCLRQGLGAGEYPLTITSGELIDASSGRAIHPRPGGGTLRVLSGISESPDCVRGTPSPDQPGGVNVSFALESPDLAPGETTVEMGFSIRANVPSRGFDFSIDFDEEDLRLISVEPVFRPGGADWDSFDFTIDNTNAKAGHDGIEEGYVAGSAVFSPGGESVLPASVQIQVLRLVFEVAARPTGTCLPVLFIDGGRLDTAGGSALVTNGLRALGQLITKENAKSFTGKNRVVRLPSPEGEVVKRPEELEAEYRLASVKGAPGSEVTVPFSMRANAAVQGFALSIDFDEEVLQATGVDRLHALGPAIPWDFWRFWINNSNAAPGNGGTDEGYVVGAAVFSLTDDICSGNIPANTDTDVLALRFMVNPRTTVRRTELNFLDGGRFPESPGVRNLLTAFSTSIYPNTASSFVFLNGVVNIAPDISVFVRGDSNGDDAVDVSDAQRTLSYLFLGDGPPTCYDAADSNDDGTIDITDPVHTLGYLFLSGENIPEPHPEKGMDPTEDPLGCTVRRD